MQSEVIESTGPVTPALESRIDRPISRAEFSWFMLACIALSLPHILTPVAYSPDRAEMMHTAANQYFTSNHLWLAVAFGFFSTFSIRRVRGTEQENTEGWRLSVDWGPWTLLDCFAWFVACAVYVAVVITACAVAFLVPGLVL